MIDRSRKEDREKQILTHIIKLYVSKAVPVSSKSVAMSMGNAISSATVRNIMSDLEEAGLIEQPHTSAGRVPTDRGYRCYVDYINNVLLSEKRELEALARQYVARMKSIREIIRMTSHILSSELHCASIILWPSVGDLYLKHLEVIKVKAETALAVLVTITNVVKNYIIRIDRDIDNINLKQLSNFINRNFANHRIEEISGRLHDDSFLKSKNIPAGMSGTALDIIDRIIEKDIEEEAYLDGMDNFADQPEFMDPDITRRILSIFSNRDEIIKLMKGELPNKDLRVYIGEENKAEMFRKCSIVTAGYSLCGSTVGRMGIIGPTRMNYYHVLRTLRYLSDVIDLKLEELRG